MKWINNLKTSTKLIGGFGSMVLLMLVIAIMGYTSMSTMDELATSLYQDQTIPIRDVGEANATLFKLRGDVYKYVYIPETREETGALITEDFQKIEELMDSYRAGQLGERRKQHWQNLMLHTILISRRF